MEESKESITKWAKTKQRSERYVLYLSLKKEFEPESREVTNGIKKSFGTDGTGLPGLHPGNSVPYLRWDNRN